MHNTKIPHKNKSLSLFYVSAYSPNENLDDLQHLLSCIKTSLDILTISETRTTRQASLSTH